MTPAAITQAEDHTLAPDIAAMFDRTRAEIAAAIKAPMPVDAARRLRAVAVERDSTREWLR